MKNILIILAITAVFLVPMIAAEQHEDRELNAFDSNLGAEIRMLQLERNTAVNVERAEHVIDYLEETEELEEIHAELVALQEEIEEAKTTELEPRRTAEEFTKLKQTLNEITREFRETAHELLDEEEILELRNENITDIKYGYEEAVRELVKKYNKERFEELAQGAGLNQSEIEERINFEEARSNDFREELRTIREERAEGLSQAKQSVIERRNEAMERAERARGMAEERREQIIERASEIREEAREIAMEVRDRAVYRMEEIRGGIPEEREPRETEETREEADIDSIIQEAMEEVEIQAESQNIELDSDTLLKYREAIEDNSLIQCRELEKAEIVDVCEEQLLHDTTREEPEVNETREEYYNYFERALDEGNRGLCGRIGDETLEERCREEI